MKLCAVSSTMLMLPKIGLTQAHEIPTKGSQVDKMELYKSGKRTPSICVYCAGGCGVVVTSVNGRAIEVEGDYYH
ncbi:MAG: hypothetical protein JSV20_03200, partial [Candidatus Bathyarchaeota archaeon]